jgi:hypothetical protein
MGLELEVESIDSRYNKDRVAALPEWERSFQLTGAAAKGKLSRRSVSKEGA